MRVLVLRGILVGLATGINELTTRLTSDPELDGEDGVRLFGYRT